MVTQSYCVPSAPATMSTRILYCKVANEAVQVKPDMYMIAGYLTENSKEAVSDFLQKHEDLRTG